MGVRIDPGFLAHDSEDPHYREQELEETHKFGWFVEDEELETVWKEALRLGSVKPVAWHVNIGSMICSPRPYVQSVSALCGLASQWKDKYTLPRVLDIGGGFGVAGLRRLRAGHQALLERKGRGIDHYYESCSPDMTPKHILSEVSAEITEKWPDPSLPEIVIEPGRFLVSASTWLVTSVLGSRVKKNSPWVYVDGGINLLPDLICGDGRTIYSVGNENLTDLVECNVGGPLCLKADVLGRNVLLPKVLRPGSLIAVGHAGAYGFSRSSSFSFPRAPMAFYDEGKLKLVWKRESLMEHILAFEITDDDGGDRL